ncbi:MAG TPA: DUF6660 family protein [Marinilabiliaceae bacterium]|nr:DUF6660 family protein [Marinilabiliaceae bacterium]
MVKFATVKILSIILSIYIIALNVQPIMDMVDLGNEDICIASIHNSDAENQQPTENDEDGCDDLCNPFMSCTTCLGCTVPVAILFSEPFENHEIQLTFYKNFHSLQYSGSIWQPPKIG